MEGHAIVLFPEIEDGVEGDIKRGEYQETGLPDFVSARNVTRSGGTSRIPDISGTGTTRKSRCRNQADHSITQSNGTPKRNGQSKL